MTGQTSNRPKARPWRFTLATCVPDWGIRMPSNGSLQVARIRRCDQECVRSTGGPQVNNGSKGACLSLRQLLDLVFLAAITVTLDNVTRDVYPGTVEDSEKRCITQDGIARSNGREKWGSGRGCEHTRDAESSTANGDMVATGSAFADVPHRRTGPTTRLQANRAAMLAEAPSPLRRSDCSRTEVTFLERRSIGSAARDGRARPAKFVPKCN